MKKYKCCNVKVYDSESKFPLYHYSLGKSMETNLQYPLYKNIINEKRAAKKLPLFIVLFSSVICIFVNIFTCIEGNVIWSIIAIVSMIFSLIMQYIIKNEFKIW